MISNIGTAGINLELSDDIKKYISRKIGRLDKYMPRHARKTATADVKLRETNNKLGNKYECEAIINLPNKQLQATEATLNMFAAVDIVEAKLKNQLAKYKEEHIAHLHSKYPGVLGKLRVHLMK
jgi:ribosomal subunit interface protein